MIDYKKINFIHYKSFNIFRKYYINNSLSHFLLFYFDYYFDVNDFLVKICQLFFNIKKNY